MAYSFLDIAMTSGVRAAQTAMGSAELWSARKGQVFDQLTHDEFDFIAERDSFYMATVSESGWPYIQHRGGPRGFLKAMNQRTLAFADYRGNRQYISVGNISTDDRVCLFLIDYPRRTRLKIYAHAEIVSLEADPVFTQQVIRPEYKAKPERIIRLHVDAFDWNCPQHITSRFTEQEITEAMQPLRDRLVHLENENAKLRAQLNHLGDRP